VWHGRVARESPLFTFPWVSGANGVKYYLGDVVRLTDDSVVVVKGIGRNDEGVMVCEVLKLLSPRALAGLGVSAEGAEDELLETDLREVVLPEQIEGFVTVSCAEPFTGVYMLTREYDSVTSKIY
jgi:hypothetical protein